MLKLEDPASEISDVFIPREYWVSDEEALCCYACKTPFDILNRRHHCRMCGNVFDLKCANHFLTPPTFIFEKEKKIRVCNDCYSKTVLYLTKNINSMKKGLSMIVKQSSTRLLEVENVTSECLTNKLYKISEDVLSYFLRDHGCYDKWFVLLKDIIKECMETVHPSSFRYDHVDIKKLIKIKKVPYKDMSLTRLVPGLVLRKNLLNKKMGANYEHPTILMIKSNLDQTWASETCVLDANSIKRENAYLEEAINKILKINPSVVFVEGSVARKVQDKLAQLNKTLLVRFRKSQFNKIAACTGAQPIEDVNSFEALNPNILGTCEHFEVINFKNKQYYNEVKNFRPDEFSEQSDYSMLFIEGSNGQKRATILISGPDYQELIKVKKLLQGVLQILRSLFIERSVISQEVLLFHTKERLWKLLAEQENLEKFSTDENKDLRDCLKIELYQKAKLKEVGNIACLLSQITAGSTGYMTEFLTESIPLENLVHKTSFVFTKFLLVPSLNPGLSDLDAKAVDFKAIVDSSLQRSKVWYNKELCMLHKKPKAFKVYYSSKDDMTLWTYLSGFADRAFEKCTKCNRKYCSHITFYFINKFYVQITVDLKAGSKAKKKRHTYSGKDLTRSEIGSRIEAHPGSIFDLLTSPSFEPNTPSKTPSPGSNASREDPDKTMDIFMYIECSSCKTRLSDVIKVRRAYLNNSFVRFLESLTNSAGHYLEHLFNQDFTPKTMGEGYTNEFLQSLKKLPLKAGLKPCCVFTPKNRVFVVDNLLVKFQVGLSKPYRVDWNGNMNRVIPGSFVDTSLIQVKKAEFLELSRNYLYLITANMNQVLLLLIQKGGLDLSLETIYSAETLFDQDNALAKEPSNVLLLHLIRLYREIMEIGNKIDVDLRKDIKDHLEVDAMQRSFCDHIMKVYDLMEEAKDKYFDSTKTNHDTLRRSTIIHELNDDNTADSSHFELIDLESPSKQASYAKEVEFLSDRRSTVIKVEVEAFIVNGEYEIEKEVQYAQQITAGSCFYLEDLDYEQYIKYKFIPMFEDKPLSILAYCLNSPKYMKEVYMAEEFNNFEKYINGTQQIMHAAEYKKFISSKLLCEDPETTIKQFNVRSPSIEIQLKFFNNLCASVSGRRPKFVAPAPKTYKIFDAEIIEDFVGCLQMGKVPKKEASSEKYVTPKFNIIAYYPVQFEALRNCNDISLASFLSSISCSKDWNENSGGRTGATFIKSHDQKFVFKKLEKKEFTMLLGFAEEYFKYMLKVCGEGKPSLIAKIYGVYEIQDEKFMNYYYIAMENILYNTPPRVKMYDLKGSELNRYVHNNGEGGKTLLDTNYILDRNSQPLPLKMKHYEIVEQAIKNDCDFLCELRVVDYSLMLVLDEKNGILKMGIIDYLRLYDLEKQLEHMGKKIIKGANPTIIRPEEYGKRFKKAMKRFFMGVSCE